MSFDPDLLHTIMTILDPTGTLENAVNRDQIAHLDFEPEQDNA